MLHGHQLSPVLQALPPSLYVRLMYGGSLRLRRLSLPVCRTGLGLIPRDCIVPRRSPLHNIPEDDGSHTIMLRSIITTGSYTLQKRFEILSTCNPAQTHKCPTARMGTRRQSRYNPHA